MNRMSDDLISRKSLFEEIQNFRCSITGLRAGKGVLASAADEYRKSILQIIEDQATAFDKEKVIEELQQEQDNRLKNWEENLFWNENRREDGIIKGLSIAIEIVEKGGVE